MGADTGEKLCRGTDMRQEKSTESGMDMGQEKSTESGMDMGQEKSTGPGTEGHKDSSGSFAHGAALWFFARQQSHLCLHWGDLWHGSRYGGISAQRGKSFLWNHHRRFYRTGAVLAGAFGLSGGELLATASHGFSGDYHINLSVRAVSVARGRTARRCGAVHYSV